MPLTIVQPGVGGTGSSTASSTGTGSAVLATQPSFPSTIGVGGATASTSGAGITFPATQSASSDANTLDDYEEGTYTATLTPQTSGSITISPNTLSYTKTGRLVTVTGYLGTTAVSSPTGYLKLSLPFTSGTGNSRQSAGFFLPNSLASGNVLNFWTYVPDNDTTANIFLGGSTSVATTSAQTWNSTSEARVCITYTV